jgi:retinol-binding protein 3
MSKKALISLALAVTTTAFAQTNPTLTTADQKEVIDSFDQAMVQNYVFHDVAVKDAEMLNSHLTSHDYDSITDPNEFCKTISGQIRAFCKDAHLRVNYHPEGIPERQEANRPAPTEIAHMKQQMRFMNGGYEHVERLSGNIGYLEVRNFLDPEAAKAPLEGAMEVLQNTDALIIDLSRNGGGEAKAVAMLLGYFFDKPTHLNDFVDGHDKLVDTSYTSSHIHGAKYLNKPIYVVVSKKTGSAAEECAYDLQSLHRAIIIGEPTWGGANPGSFYKLNDHYEAFIPYARARNPYTMKNWEGTGVTPDVAAENGQGLRKAQSLALADLMKKNSDPELKQVYQKAIDELQAHAQ